MASPRESERAVLVIGATGLIGSSITARLKAEGLFVVGTAREAGPEARKLPADRIHFFDLRNMKAADDWEPHLANVALVINCAGILQSGGSDSTLAVHETAPIALFEACRRAGVRRIIHFSAMGVNEGALSDFSRTKGNAEAALERSGLDWVILRPSVVVGRAAYGGSALFRGLASLPWLPRLREAGPLSVVQLDDVVETVIHFVRHDGAACVALDLAGPETLSFEEVVARYRAWLGWKPARVIDLPGFMMSLAYSTGDLAGRLGWRPPIRSTARSEMRRGAAGDPAAWTEATGIIPAPMDQTLLNEPASVQERWFARLFLLKPVVIGVFAAFWLLTGFVSLGPGYHIGVDLMREGGAGALSGPTVVAGGLADLAVGLAMLWRPTTKYALWAALALTIFYVVAGTVILPRLWLEPLGPMMKVWPILALNLVALAILEER